MKKTITTLFLLLLLLLLVYGTMQDRILISSSTSAKAVQEHVNKFLWKNACNIIVKDIVLCTNIDSQHFTVFTIMVYYRMTLPAFEEDTNPTKYDCESKTFKK